MRVGLKVQANLMYPLSWAGVASEHQALNRQAGSSHHQIVI